VGTVWVVGSINLDLVIETAQLPRPGETVMARSLTRHPGGKGANQAVAAARLGATTRMVGRVGDDEGGPILRRFLTDLEVDTSDVRTAAGDSGAAVVMVDDRGENSIVAVAGANSTLGADDVGQLAVSDGDVVVTQNEVPLEASAAAVEVARASGATSISNPSPATSESLAMARAADVVVLNEIELALLTGRTLDERSSIEELAAALSAIRGDRSTIVTLGARGVVASIDGEQFELPSIPTRVVDTTGAGDGFVGAVAARLAAGVGLRDAIDVALVASSIVVTRQGAGPAMPTAAEVASVTTSAGRAT
jgi:ribokinase